MASSFIIREASEASERFERRERHEIGVINETQPDEFEEGIESESDDEELDQEAEQARRRCGKLLPFM